MKFSLSTLFSARCIKVFFLATTMLTTQTAYGVEVKMPPSHLGAIGLQKAGAMAKAGPALNKVFAEHQAHVKAQLKKPFTPSNPFLQYAHGKIVIDAVASGDGNVLLSDLKGLGLTQGAKAGRIVSGWLPLGIVKKALALDSLRFISASYRPVTNAGSVTSQGDLAMYADLARDDKGLNGTGITVGVLSDSYDQQNGAAADVTSGDLPGGVTNLDDSANCGSLLFPQPCTDEGRAMMQIVHDVAPGAGLAFHTAFTGLANFAQGIRDLANTANAKVIVDDVMYYAEPMFQDGIIAQAVDDVVAGGAAYFSAAGNQARHSYEHDYVPSGEPLYIYDPGFPPFIPESNRFVGILHDFDPGTSVDYLQSISVPNGACMVVSLQWDQPFGSLAGGNGSQNDLDIYLIDGDENNMTILEKSDSDNVLGGDPVELLQFCNTANYANLNLLISYFLESEPGDNWVPTPTFMKYVYFGSMTVNEYATYSSTVYGHANAAGAEATGAAYYMETPRFYNGPPLLDYFSSAGGTPVLFSSANGSRLSAPEVRKKPEIVAPNGVDTTFFYPTSDRNGNGIPDFSGTSAAAPHAAAVAALMFQANMTATPGTIYTALEETAVNISYESEEPDGFDFDSGWGLVKADEAVAAISAGNTPPTDCNNNGVCESGENCDNCPSDCIGSSGVAVACGNGICEPANQEDCLSCPQDCRGKQVGATKLQYCCGDGDGLNPVGCDDSRCSAEGWLCSDTPPAPYCCGDGSCTGIEDYQNCGVDCPAPYCDETENSCTDGIDNDCDLVTDCDDPDCKNDSSCASLLSRGEPCTADNQCLSGDCHDIKLICK